MKMMRTAQNNPDDIILAFIKNNGCVIKANIERLYKSGDLTSSELATCVGRFITLADYNEIIGIE